MKILMFGWEFPPHISGGLGTACYGMTKALCERGNEVTFVLPRVKDRDASSHVTILGANEISREIVREEKLGIESRLKLMEINSTLLPYLNETTYKEYIEKISEIQNVTQITRGGSVIEIEGDYGKDLVAEVYRYALIGSYLGKKDGFDLVHAHDWMTFPAGIEAKQASGLPLVIHVHATEFDRSGENPNPDIYNIEKWGMDEADVILAVSQRTKNIIVEKYNVSPDKIFVVHNAVTKEQTLDKGLAPKFLKEKIVLFLGRVTMQKGPDYFVEAAHRVLKQNKNVRFVMAGAGDMLPRMMERAASLRIQDRFHFTGFLRGVEREKIFSMSDLYVMPSVSEPFGITPFEVMKYGVPVIVSRQSGITEVIENIVKVDFWDIEKLSNAIIDILSNPAESTQMVQKSVTELSRIDWSHVAGKISGIYSKVVRT